MSEAERGHLYALAGYHIDATADTDSQVTPALRVSRFRLYCTDRPDDAQVDSVVSRLRQASPRFAALWDGKDVTPFVTTRRVFHHPIAGRIELDHHRLEVLDQPGMQLVVYTSAPGTDATRRLLGDPKRATPA